jgi:hypothetical protein
MGFYSIEFGFIIWFFKPGKKIKTQLKGVGKKFPHINYWGRLLTVPLF